MKERPILMKGAMVRAVLDGRKTQTRRIVKQLDPAMSACTTGNDGRPMSVCWAYGGPVLHCPYGKPGDRIWVRETFGYVSPDENQRPHSECNIEYRADLAPDCTDRPGSWPVEECAGDPERPRWRPSIHMPRAASRILLEIVSVRVERLNDCSDADARAEGALGGHGVIPSYNYHATPSEHFSHLWESINGTGSWAANPWVWVIEFKRVMS
ncbi:hypothetical protein [Janthinobacterium sp.]|uniref:hypothetical protein n=1 Tax=Janthinobacterium sp. TaxID=1871054 RepID=UPI002DB695B0|nr:hypothetical protein [Janthinobacterium sp.]HEU4817711.1 hypothetical protein [Janthinobacterium sp.]